MANPEHPKSKPIRLPPETLAGIRGVAEKMSSVRGARALRIDTAWRRTPEMEALNRRMAEIHTAPLKTSEHLIELTKAVIELQAAQRRTDRKTAWVLALTALIVVLTLVLVVRG